MIRFFLIIFFFTNLSCSFDNKTGIWTDASKVAQKPDDDIGILDKNKKIYKKSKTITQVEYDIHCTGTFSVIKRKCGYKISNNQLGAGRPKLERVFTERQIYDSEKSIELGKIIRLDEVFKNPDYGQQYFSSTNNISNNLYNNNKILISKTSKAFKLTKNSKLNTVLYSDNKTISYNEKGSIHVFSTIEDKKVWEFNFYKKSFKKIKKKIYLLVNNNKIFAADNLGYFYALDLKTGKLIWAKNFGIPFRSNIKYKNDKLFLANEDNIIYSINAENGDTNWQFASSATFLKSSYINNILINELNKSILFLNTSGELFSINYDTKYINWVLNFKNYSSSGDTGIFLSKPLVANEEKILITTKTSLLSYDLSTGEKKWTMPLAPELRPIISNENVFLFTKKKLLICLDINTGEIIWSKKVFNQIQNKKIRIKKEKTTGEIKNLIIAGTELHLLTSNGFLLSFNYLNGNIKSFNKISKNGISAEPLFIEGNMFIFDKKNKLLKFN